MRERERMEEIKMRAQTFQRFFQTLLLENEVERFVVERSSSSFNLHPPSNHVRYTFFSRPRDIEWQITNAFRSHFHRDSIAGVEYR